ncbi:MAG: class I SAM-dependent methyltransferase [Myxococcota bacterium]
MPLDAKTKAAVPSKFDRIASTYDLLTGLNPGYRAHLRQSAQRLGMPRRARVLDLCCGTGTSTAALHSVYPGAEIVGVDASAKMIERAKTKPIASHARFVVGNAMDLGAAGIHGPFDGVLMAYGIRNVPNMDRCLEGIRTILQPEGRICFHEYSVAGSIRSKLVWNAVTAGIIIPGGALTAGTTEIYRYLRRSVFEFDSVLEFEKRLSRAGFVRVRTHPMKGWQRGILHSFVAQRPSAEITPCPSDEITPCPSDEITPCPSDEITPCPSAEITPCPSDEIGGKEARSGADRAGASDA